VTRAFVRLDDDAAHALDDRAVVHGSVDLGDDGFVARVTGFKQLDDAGQTAGDVLGLGRGTGDLRQDVARVDFLPVVPPTWKVRMVSWVPGSPMDSAAMTPTASPISTSLPLARLRP
jgi:hypothetical protein